MGENYKMTNTKYMGYRIHLKIGGKEFGLEDTPYLNKSSASRIINNAEKKGIEYKIIGVMEGMPLGEESISKECFKKSKMKEMKQ